MCNSYFWLYCVFLKIMNEVSFNQCIKKHIHMLLMFLNNFDVLGKEKLKVENISLVLTVIHFQVC